MDWFPKHPTDYRNDTWGLTLAEHGAYNLLIDHYMVYEAPLPNDDIALAGILGVPVDEWKKVKKNVLTHFTIRGKKIHHKRCENELKTAFKKRQDGKTRQKKHRKLLKDNEPVTCDKHVSNAPTDRTGQDRQYKEKKPANADTSRVSIWDYGVSYLSNFGKSESASRSIIGKWRKSFSDEVILAAFIDCEKQNPVEPVSYITKILKAEVDEYSPIV